MSSATTSGEPPEARDELARLLREAIDGELTTADVAKLQEVLRESPEACSQYIHTIHLSEGVRRWAQSQVVGSVRLAPESLLESQLAAATRGSWGQQFFGSSRWFKGLMLCAAAAALVVACFQWFGGPDVDNMAAQQLKPPGEIKEVVLADSQSVVARIVATTADVTWSEGTLPPDFLLRLRPGDSVGPQTGRVTIEFCEGAFLVVQAPALLQVTSGDSARLVYGRVSGRAEQGNFMLLTPQATVVDIGTEFGVDVSGERTGVFVFEGEVDVYRQIQSGDNQALRLTQGMTAQIAPDGQTTTATDQLGTQYSRDFFAPKRTALNPDAVSLLDLLNGYETIERGIAAGIDPVTGYWGRVNSDDSRLARAKRGDTQFTETDWNIFVDGVFVPRANGREMQINSDGQMVFLPPNSGTTWGPIWARRRSEFDQNQMLLASLRSDHWGTGTLAPVRERLALANEGLLGFHANAGITFNLQSIARACGQPITAFHATIANLDSSRQTSPEAAPSVADFRVFVNGKLRYSRLGFGQVDGDAQMTVPLQTDDQFLTLVATDADGDPACDHVVLIDPVLALRQ